MPLDGSTLPAIPRAIDNNARTSASRSVERFHMTPNTRAPGASSRAIAAIFSDAINGEPKFGTSDTPSRRSTISAMVNSESSSKLSSGAISWRLR